jgi:aryl-alcohol dehydrogenase-like predicted oxidoreductase
MEYVKLGRTGLEVSRVCLGCMSWGTRDTRPWMLGEEAGRALIRRALDAGINFFDTANVYSDGTSEEILGRALADCVSRRDEVVVATKVYFPMRGGPNGGGLSRKVIFQAIDDSLRRLRTDHVDLYQIHRWDETTPLAETLEALHDVVRAGKALYLGASSMYAWQLARALSTAERRGWTRFVSMQNHYNLLYREEEREMLPLCRAEGLGVIPWSPLARGRLAREPQTTSRRRETDPYGEHLYDGTAAADRAILDRVGEIARRRGVSRAQVALAWLADQPGVTAPIVGVAKSEQLDDAVAAASLHLTADEMRALAEPYVPHAVAGIEVPFG